MLGKIVGRLVDIEYHAGSDRAAHDGHDANQHHELVLGRRAAAPTCCAIPNLPSDQRTVTQWFDTGAFVQPRAVPVRQRRRGHLRAAGLVNLDFSLQREFKFTERIRLHLRGEFFNALNHTNFGLPGTRLNGSGFGVISSLTVASGPRTIQVGARIAF